MANGFGDWLKRYWLWLVVAALAILGVLAYWFFVTGNKEPLKILKEAEEGIKKLKDEKAIELKALEKEMDARTQNLIDIKSIKDEDERLTALAAFANKRK